MKILVIQTDLMAREKIRITSTHDLKRPRVESVYANLVCDATYEMVWKICRYRRGSKNRRRQAMRICGVVWVLRRKLPTSIIGGLRPGFTWEKSCPNRCIVVREG